MFYQSPGPEKRGRPNDLPFLLTIFSGYDKPEGRVDKPPPLRLSSLKTFKTSKCELLGLDGSLLILGAVFCQRSEKVFR